MRIEIMNLTNESTKDKPTELIELEEVKCCYEDGEHYGSDWFFEVEPNEFGDLLVNLQKHENDSISFFSCSDGIMRVWIGQEDAEWG